MRESSKLAERDHEKSKVSTKDEGDKRLPNLDFYMGKIRITKQKLNIFDIIRKKQNDYEWLEECHDYIQWLFPNHYKSMFNKISDPLSKGEALMFRSSKKIGERLMMSFEIYCNFLGVKIDLVRREFMIVSKHRAISALNINMHNHLRIKRILACLSVTGFRAVALWFLSILKTLVKSIKELKGSQQLEYTVQHQWMVYSDQEMYVALENCECEMEVFEQVNPYLREVGFQTKKKRYAEKQTFQTSGDKIQESKKQIVQAKNVGSENQKWDGKYNKQQQKGVKSTQQCSSGANMKSSLKNSPPKKQVEQSKLYLKGQPGFDQPQANYSGSLTIYHKQQAKSNAETEDLKLKQKIHYVEQMIRPNAFGSSQIRAKQKF